MIWNRGEPLISFITLFFTMKQYCSAASWSRLIDIKEDRKGLFPTHLCQQGSRQDVPGKHSEASGFAEVPTFHGGTVSGFAGSKGGSDCISHVYFEQQRRFSILVRSLSAVM